VNIGYATWLGAEGLKAYVQTHDLSVQRNDEGTAWYVFAVEGNVSHATRVLKDGGAEQTDFEASYSSMAGSPVTPVRTYVSKEQVAPVAADGKPFYLPNIFPGEVLLNFAGRGDLNGQRYGGGLFSLEKDGVGTAYADFSFQDGVYLAGGHIMWVGGGFGSYVKMELFSPATTLTDASGDGNANVAPTGLGFNIIVPAAGNGAKNLGSVITPVPANDDESNAQNGFWNYTDPWVGKGSVSPGVPQSSKYNLFDTLLPISHFTDLHLVLESGDRTLLLENVKPKWILPEWFFRVTVINANAEKTLRVGWDLAIARRKSV
jgi:hypothetical protein